MNWSALNWIDIVLLLLIAASIVEGLRTGLTRVVIGLIAIAIGTLAGFWTYALIANKIAFLIHWQVAANVLGFCIVFFGVLLIGGIFATALSKIFNWVGLAWLDHILGGLAGALRGMIVVAALVTIVFAFMPASLPAEVSTSQVMPYAIQASNAMAELAPYSLRLQVQNEIEKLKQAWTDRHPAEIPTDVKAKSKEKEI